MTTYTDPYQIYVQTLRDLMGERADEATVLARMEELIEWAERERAEAREPGFVPSLSYIPAHGADAKACAMKDYCRLKRMTDESQFLQIFLHHVLKVRNQ